MKVPLLDLQAQYRVLRKEIEPVVREIFESQRFILGPWVERCERGMAELCGSRDAVGVSSGSDALLISLMSAGLRPGDEVVTTPYTFFATGGSIVRAGCRPVFADIDPLTFNLAPQAAAEAVGAGARALMPVHLFGQMADMEPLMELAGKHELVVIEDACQAIGARYRGRRAGSIGDYGCFSFFPSKNLGGAGDGGMVTVRDVQAAVDLRRLRNHGMEPKYHHHLLGGNFRLDALQAAVVAVKLPHLAAWSKARRENAARYDRLLAEAGLAGDPVVLPVRKWDEPDGHIFNQYVIRVPRRDALRSWLQARDIGCEVYYPVPLHLQPCFADLNFRRGDFPESERAAAETMALPVYPELSADQAAYVVQAISEFYR